MEKWIKQYRLGHIRQVAIWVSHIITSWRSDSSNISLVVYVLDKLLFGSPVKTSWRSESRNVSLDALDKLLYYSWNLSFLKNRKFRKDQSTDGQNLLIKSPRWRLMLWVPKKAFVTLILTIRSVENSSLLCFAIILLI